MTFVPHELKTGKGWSMESPVTILYSGGLDSFAMMFKHVDIYGDKVPIHTVSINVGSKYHVGEQAARKRMGEIFHDRYPDLKMHHTDIDCSWFGAPLVTNPMQPHLGKVIIPARNLMVVVNAMCASLPRTQMWLGALATEDVGNGDKTQNFKDRVNDTLTETLIELYPDVTPELAYPVGDMDKLQIMDYLVNEKGCTEQEMQSTFSCLGTDNESEVQCGVCSSCVRRRSLFPLFGMEDVFQTDTLPQGTMDMLADRIVRVVSKKHFNQSTVDLHGSEGARLPYYITSVIGVDLKSRDDIYYSSYHKRVMGISPEMCYSALQELNSD